MAAPRREPLQPGAAGLAWLDARWPTAHVWLDAPLRLGPRAIFLAAAQAELRMALRPGSGPDARALARLCAASGEEEPLRALEQLRARGVASEQLFPLLIRAATQSDEGGPAGHQALLDYFDFVSRVNAVVVTARALAEVLLDPELHKFAAHLLALLHQCMGGIREVRSDVKAIRRRVQEQFDVIKAYGDAPDVCISDEHQAMLRELVEDTVSVVAGMPPGIAARLAPVQAAARLASSRERPDGLQEPPSRSLWTLDEVPSRESSPSPESHARAAPGCAAPLGWGEAQTRPPNNGRHNFSI